MPWKPSISGRTSRVCSPRPCPWTAVHAPPRRRTRVATPSDLRGLIAAGLLKHPLARRLLRGRCSPDDARAADGRACGSSCPASASSTDRTAGWLWGADMILAPNDHLGSPGDVFCPPGHRLRNGADRERGADAALPGDVAGLDGLRVTTPLRTACDLGRLLHRRSGVGGHGRAGAVCAPSRVAELRCRRRDDSPGTEASSSSGRWLRSWIRAPESPGESILTAAVVGRRASRARRARCEVPASARRLTCWLDMGLEDRRIRVPSTTARSSTATDAGREHDEAAS